MTKQTNMSDMAPEDTMLDVANNEDYTVYNVLRRILDTEDKVRIDLISKEPNTFQLRIHDGTKYTYLSKEFKRSIKPIISTSGIQADYDIIVITSFPFEFNDTSVAHGLYVEIHRNDITGKFGIASIDEILVNTSTKERYCDHSCMFFTGHVGLQSGAVHVELKCDKCGHTEWNDVRDKLVDIDGTATVNVCKNRIQEQSTNEDDNASTRS